MIIDALRPITAQSNNIKPVLLQTASSLPPNTPATASEVEFIQYHWPALDSGVYVIQSNQKIKSINNQAIPEKTYTAKALNFAVLGERFAPLADGQDVSLVFPANGNMGDYSNALPYITFHRSTLPWERLSTIYPVTAGTLDQTHAQRHPWLALILFYEGTTEPDRAGQPGIPIEDAPTQQTITLQQLKATSGNIKFPRFVYEPNQQDSDPVNVIDVKRSLLEKILPSAEDLLYLAHVRQPKDANGNPTEDEMATLICNRLPQLGGKTTVYLVSLEDRYQARTNSNGTTARDSYDQIIYDFDYQGAGPNDYIRLVTLFSWSFSCLGDTFGQEVEALNRVPATYTLPPINNASHANPYLAGGYVPLAHSLRNGQKTVSWYHGPFLPGRNQQSALTQPVMSSDELLRYNEQTGMFDISYAAAWELGRWLTLKETGIAQNLFTWKRNHVQHLHQIEQQIEHLPLDSTPVNTDIPANVAQWFNDLRLLRPIPLNYLIPNTALLPTSSIRLFWLDHYWIDCLLDGAFSIGRVDDDQDPQASISGNDDLITGVIINSTVVTHYRDLHIEASNQILNDQYPLPFTDAQKLNLLRMDRLTDSIILCLFAGEVKTLDLYRTPQTMHFGVDAPDESNRNYHKILRTREGREDVGNVINTLPWKDQRTKTIDVHQLSINIYNQVYKPSGSTNKTALSDDDFTSAQFALQMIEGTARVRFIKGSDSSDR